MEENEVKEKQNLQRQTTEDPLIIVEEAEFSTLTYGLVSRPPIGVTLSTALQHILITLPGCLYTASAVSDVACAPYNHPIRATLFCGTLFMAGFCTFIETLIGIRLPIVQGPSATFLVPLMSMTANPEWRCTPEMMQPRDYSVNMTQSEIDMEIKEESAEIYSKLQKMSGALMLASLFEIIMGSVGLMGLLLRFIGPITVATTISLIGVSIAKLPIIYSRPSFPVGLGCMILILVFVLYCQNVSIPIPRCGKKQSETKKRSFPVFQLIPILIAVCIMWIVSWILTITGAFTDDKNSIEYFARTDAKADVVKQSPWFQISYPGMFGLPQINFALALGFTISCAASLVESVGDYYAAHKACEVAAPPNHAISRGILIEGLGTLVSGAVGVGHATTSYSGNISVLTLSKNASRSVMYAAGIILMMVSMVGKVGAALTTIPNPVLGGVSIIVTATLLSIGFSNLKHVDMTSTRNLLVVGMPFVGGLTVPMCVEMYPEVIDTGIEQLNQVLHVVIGSPMFLGGLLAIILDNTVPGSYKSRGMVDPHQMNPFSKETESTRIYSWPAYPKIAKLLPFLTYLPFMPQNADPHDTDFYGEEMMDKIGNV